MLKSLINICMHTNFTNRSFLFLLVNLIDPVQHKAFPVIQIMTPLTASVVVNSTAPSKSLTSWLHNPTKNTIQLKLFRDNKADFSVKVVACITYAPYLNRDVPIFEFSCEILQPYCYAKDK